MKYSLKGALFSGLVFPGIGQIILKHYIRGAVLIAAISVSMLVFVIKAVQQALAILEKIQFEGDILTMSAITDAATRATTVSDSMTLKLLLLLILFLWIIGIVDAYRIGRKKDEENNFGYD